jgi:hypothetical protein
MIENTISIRDLLVFDLEPKAAEDALRAAPSA